MIDEARLAKALTFLATTDEEAANLRVDMERAEFKAKAIRDALFKHLEGSVADRQAEAGSSKQYAEAMSEYFEAMRQYEKIANKRKTENVMVDAWRSLNSNRRMGQV